jgi:dTDP-4-dehydrorhamnose reductase
MKRILVTGKNGQVGFELMRSLAPIVDVIAVGQQECNLADESAIRKLIRTIRPDIIVNSAAYTAVDKAEAETELADLINHNAPRVIGEEAEALGATVIHFSTDYVFDGEKRDPYLESDMTIPVSVYGRTKRDGEKALATVCDRHLILRTSWVYGAYGNNFIKTILRLACDREFINVVDDQHGAPTSAALLADLTSHVISRLASKDAICYGTYHVAGSGRTTWHALAVKIVTEARRYDRNLKLMPENIYPISTLGYPTPAKRPKNSLLNSSKFKKTFDLLLPEWEVNLTHTLKEILSR